MRPIPGVLRDRAPADERCFLQLDDGVLTVRPARRASYPTGFVLASAPTAEAVVIQSADGYGWTFGRRLNESGVWLVLDSPLGSALFRPDDGERALDALSREIEVSRNEAKQLPVRPDGGLIVVAGLCIIATAFLANGLGDAMALDLSRIEETLLALVLLAPLVWVVFHLLIPAWARRRRRRATRAVESRDT